MDPTTLKIALLVSAVLVINGLVRALKEDTPIPITIPARWRPLVAVVLGQAGAGLALIVSHYVPWLQLGTGEALAIGAAGSAGSTLLHSLWKDTIRGKVTAPTGAQEGGTDEKQP